LFEFALVENGGGRSQNDVLGNRKGGDQPKFLVNHGHTGAQGVSWGTEAVFDSVKPNRSLVGPVHTGQDVHQGCLPGSVLTQNGVHGAGADLEFRPGVRYDARKSLPDVVEFDRERT
jgi:hypothetical protein